MFCKKCGTVVPEGDRFCQQCGYKFDDQPVAATAADLSDESACVANESAQQAICDEPTVAVKDEQKTVYMPPVASPSEPPKKKKKGLVIGLIALATVAVAAIVVAVLFKTGVIGGNKEETTEIISHSKNADSSLTDIDENAEIALEIGDIKISDAQFDYYYYMSYQYFAQMESGYQQQGMSMGFPLDRAPDEVLSGQTDEAGNEIYYDKVIAEYAANIAFLQFSMYSEAKAAGYTLNAEEQEQIDEVIASLKTQAETNSYTLDDYIKEMYSEGLNEKGLRKLLEIELITTRYNEDLETKAYESVTAEQIKAEYDANMKLYNYADIRYYSITLPVVTKSATESDEEFNKRKSEAQKAEIDAANAVLSKINDAESFKAAALEHKNKEDARPSETDPTVEIKGLTYNAAKTVLSEEAAEWILDAARNTGDKNLFITEKAAYIVMVEAPAYAGNSVDVRHCLVKFDVKDSYSVPTDEQKKAAFDEATKIKEEWVKAGGTEEAFIEIVKKYNDDTASNEKGGLYESITKSSNYVENFKLWAVDPARKEGDCDIVETEFGYHIMYFVKNNGPDWNYTAGEKLQKEAYEKAYDELLGENGKYKLTKNDEIIDKCAKDFCDKIREKV